MVKKVLFSIAILAGIGTICIAASELRIKRLHLFFQNGQPKITVSKGEPGLWLSAEIHTFGVGILEGYWELDGRMIGRITRHVASPLETVTLKSPEIPGLSTAEVGSHRVRLVITNPRISFILPQAVFFVKAQDQVNHLSLNMLAPKDGTVLTGDPLEFQWEKGEGIKAYCIEFQDDQTKNPIFSTCTFEPNFVLNSLALNIFFQSGKAYTWQVTGIDDTGKTIAEGKKQKFSWEYK
ncbi:MAG: hypothetical protein AB1659_02090 [Thermodesulfobacteriota bacterium]